MTSRIPSPARSLGAPATPRRKRPRGSRSVGSPARSNVSGRASRLAEDLRDFALTPLATKSVLTDNTDIEEPSRKSWWKKLDDTSLEVVEVLHGDNGDNVGDIVEEFVDIEVPSLVSKNMTLDLPESSGNESIGSIVIPQRRLFTQKENAPRNMFDAVIGSRESLAKPQKTTKVDMTANVCPKNLIGQGFVQRSRPAFPAGLVSTTPNKMAYNDESIEVTSKKLFGQQDAANKKKLFTKTALETSPRKSENKEHEITGPKTLFNEDQQPKHKPVFPAELFNVSPNKTAANYTRLAGEIQGRAPNLFGNRGRIKRKNMFADFIVSESEEEIQDIQPKVFGFSKARAGSKEPQSGRGSSVSRGVRDSPMSITTDLEMDDWKMLPSSTMMVDQLEDIVAGTPMKKIRLSKLSEQKESDGSKASTTVNKTKMSNKSTSSMNKSKILQNDSKVVEEEMVVDEIELTDKQNKSKTEVENENVNITYKSNILNGGKNIDEVVIENNATHNINERTHSVHKNASRLSETNANIDKQNDGENDVVVESNATYNIKNRTHSIHKNSSTLSKTNTNIEIDQQELEVPKQKHENEPEIPERARCLEQANIEIVNSEDNDGQEMALTYEEDVEEPIVQEKQTESNQELQKMNNITDEFKSNASVNKINKKNAKLIVENNGNQVEESKNKTEVIEAGQLPHTKEKDTLKDVIAADDYADDNFEDVEMNVESVLEDEVSEVAQDDSKVETSIDCKETEVEESIEQIQKEIDRGEDEQDEKELSNVEENQEQIDLHKERAEKSHEVATELSQKEIGHDQEKKKEHVEQIEQDDEEEAEPSEAEVEQSQEEIQQDDEEEAQPSEVEVEQSQEEIEPDNEEEAEPSEARVEQSQEDIEQDDEEAEEQSQKEFEQDEDEAAEQSEAEDEQTQEAIEQVEVEAEQSQEEDEEEDDRIETEVEQSEEEIDDNIEQSQEEADQDDEENDNNQEMAQDQETDDNIGQDSHANMPSDQVPTSELTDEIQESPNVSHDTTGRNRKKIRNETQLKSPEAILKGTTLTNNTTFEHQGRNTSVRKTKSMIRPLDHNPVLAASIRDSIGTNGSDSSAQGSGWDSHRTTRKTLRQTFGKNFTPRKSLRTLVMEKSAQRKTLANVDVDITKAPQANSTEIHVNEELYMPSMVDNVEDLTEETVSDHEVSRNTRQTTLEMYLQKLKKDTLERKMKMENAVRESLKAPSKNVIKEFNLTSKLGSGGRKVSKPAAKPKKAKASNMHLGELPKQLLEDMKYKPPKRFMPTNASWTTKRLYKFVESKLEPRYDYKARVRAEKLVATLYSFSKMIQRLDVAPSETIEELKVELARLSVVKTHFDFYDFFDEFMPREMRIKVIPDIQNKLPMPKYGLHSDIIRDVHSR